MYINESIALICTDYGVLSEHEELVALLFNHSRTHPKPDSSYSGPHTTIPINPYVSRFPLHCQFLFHLNYAVCYPLTVNPPYSSDAV